MRRNALHFKIVGLLCAGCALLFTGCSTYVPLSERAIVKAIYLNETQQGIQASLVVYTCKASANTADVTGTPRLYQGEGATIEKALEDAEKQQNKKPFYAQNRLLFLGKNTFDSVTEYLSYFGAEEVSRANLSVFLTTTTQEEFSKLEESISAIVDESERLTLESRESGNKSRAIHELRYDEKGRFYGYLPLLTLGENDFTGVNELLLYDSGVPICALREAVMQLTLLLSDKSNTLKISLPGEKDITVKTQRLVLEREPKKDGTFSVGIAGKVESITQNGHVLQGEEEQQALAACNDLLGNGVQQLLNITTQAGNDVFSCNWWMQNEQNRNCTAIEARSSIRVA